MAASAVLLPLVENAVVRACSYLGGQALTVSRSESVTRRIGDTITPMVEQYLGEDWAFFFRHIWGREGAIRHAYCHGYIHDERVSSRDADLCVYALLSLAYNMITKYLHDNLVRKIAYGLWQSRGCPEGDSTTDWYEAERRLIQTMITAP